MKMSDDAIVEIFRVINFLPWFPQFFPLLLYLCSKVYLRASELCGKGEARRMQRLSPAEELPPCSAFFFYLF